jgi:hypothetical protein
VGSVQSGVSAELFLWFLSACWILYIVDFGDKIESIWEIVFPK